MPAPGRPAPKPQIINALTEIPKGNTITLAESANTDEAAAPDVGHGLPPGYRDWRLISVAHEAGNLNDLRAILGNDVAIKAYRDTVISPYIEQRHSETALQK